MISLSNLMKLDAPGRDLSAEKTDGGNKFGNLLKKIVSKKNRPSVSEYMSGKNPSKSSGQAVKEGMRVSLKWRDGKMVKGGETPVSKTYGRNGEEVAGADPRQEGYRKISNGSELTQILSGTVAENLDRLKMKTGEKGLESNHIVELQDILDVKNSDIFGKAGFSESNDGLDILKLGDGKIYDVKNLIGKITQYLVQNGIKNLDFLEVIVDHEDLGKFKIDAHKAGIKGQINLNIEAMSSAGQDFFRENEALLAKNLMRAGINIQELKIVDAKDNVFSNIVNLKHDAQPLDTEKELHRKDERSEYEREGEGRDREERHSEDETVNEEEEHAWYR